VASLLLLDLPSRGKPLVQFPSNQVKGIEAGSGDN